MSAQCCVCMRGQPRSPSSSFAATLAPPFLCRLRPGLLIAWAQRGLIQPRTRQGTPRSPPPTPAGSHARLLWQPAFAVASQGCLLGPCPPLAWRHERRGGHLVPALLRASQVAVPQVHRAQPAPRHLLQPGVLQGRLGCRCQDGCGRRQAAGCCAQHEARGPALHGCAWAAMHRRDDAPPLAPFAPRACAGCLGRAQGGAQNSQRQRRQR